MLSNSIDWNSFWSLNGATYSQLSYSKKRIINILSRHIIKPSIVIDAGCGTGFFSKYFLDNNHSVYAVDFSMEALKVCKQLCNEFVTYINADLVESHLNQIIKTKVDYVFSDGLLEHFSVYEQMKILFNIKNCLKSDGKIITFVPNLFSFWQIIRPFYMPNINEKPFILKRLIKLHESCGFRTIETGGINVLPCLYSPEYLLGKSFGMLLYYIGEKNK